VSLKESGHSFCDECAKASLHQNEVFPNCRVVVAGSIPNWFDSQLYCVKELVGPMPMEVICRLNGKVGSVQCNDGEELLCGCHWSGKCQDLQNHNSVCKFKVVTSSVGGCNHTCRCSDMIMHQLEVSFSI
jgi:hypothetical protein